MVVHRGNICVVQLILWQQEDRSDWMEEAMRLTCTGTDYEVVQATSACSHGLNDELREPKESSS